MKIASKIQKIHTFADESAKPPESGLRDCLRPILHPTKIGKKLEKHHS